MRRFNRDNLPHLMACLFRAAGEQWHTFLSRLSAHWWGVELGAGCRFHGTARFRRHPSSRIAIQPGCEFRSSFMSNFIGINRPCLVSTLSEGAEIRIGPGCGFSGTVIGCASRIVVGAHVRCGANTLITDTDWHGDDPRSGDDAAVTIEDNVWLGVNVTVLKGAVIGKNTVVGAGSLVTGCLPADVVAAGVPARVLKKFEPTRGRAEEFEPSSHRARP